MADINFRMQEPEITFRNMEPSDAVLANIREKIAKLEQFTDQIKSCRVVFELQHQRHHKGNLYQVRVDLTLPGTELVVNRNLDQHHAHEDAYVAIRDAFDAAQRQLQDYTDRWKRKEKSHETAPHGKILELFPAMNYGIIESSDGREIYFHRNSIVNADFDDLEEGFSVRFDEEPGDKGPQASTVKLEGKHHATA